jgi:hypothetical protein
MIERNFKPRNIRLEDAVMLLLAGHPVRFVLEPGDATRYEILVIPQSGRYEDTITGNGPEHLIVVRSTGGTLTVANIRKQKGEYYPGDFDAISNGNRVTSHVFADFFRFLMEKMP